MKSVLLVVLLAAAATAAVVSNEVPDVVKLPDMADGDDVTDENLIEMQDVVVTYVDEIADAADLADVAEEAAVASRSNLSQGTIGSSDVLVYDAEHRAHSVAGNFITDERTIRTNCQVTVIRVTRIGASQSATPSVVGGGIGNSFVTIRIRSSQSRGYNYHFEVYGKYG